MGGYRWPDEREGRMLGADYAGALRSFMCRTGSTVRETQRVFQLYLTWRRGREEVGPEKS